MKPLVLFAGLVGAGVVGALSTTLFRPAPDLRAAAPADTTRIESRIDMLEARMDRQDEAIDAIRRAPPPPAPLAAAPGGEPAAVAGTAPLPVTEAQLREAAERAVEEVARKDREERDARTAEAMVQREARNLDRLTQELQLTPYQREEVQKVLAARREAFLALRDRMRGNDTPPDDAARESIRAEFELIRTRTDDALKSVLSTAQFEQFKKSDDAGPGGFGGRGGGRPGGNGGRGR